MFNVVSKKEVIHFWFGKLYYIFIILCFPFLNKLLPIVFSGFTDFFKNIVAFILLFLALKHDNLKIKIFLAAVSFFILFIYYRYNITNNFVGIITFFAINTNKKLLKYILVFCVVFILAFPFIRKIHSQVIYGIPEYKKINVAKKPNISLIENPQKEILKTLNYSIEITKIASIELEARVVYIENYDKLFSYDYYEHPLYDEVAPLDLSVFVGEMAENWKKYKVSHDQRVLFVHNNVNFAEWTNLHIIPSNNFIRKGFYTISRGDEVYLKGYLIDWNGIGDFDYFKIKTARSFGDTSQEKVGGNFTWLCSQFFVEELNVNGFTYK